MEPRIPNFNTLADAVDRLAVEINKLSRYENLKREEHGKENPDVELIAKWDNLSRDACEYRSLLKNEINKILKDCMEEQCYNTLEEIRTFRPPERSAADLIAEMCEDRANASLRAQLAQAFDAQTSNLGVRRLHDE